jgi:hypothetical protein
MVQDTDPVNKVMNTWVQENRSVWSYRESASSTAYLPIEKWSLDIIVITDMKADFRGLYGWR